MLRKKDALQSSWLSLLLAAATPALVMATLANWPSKALLAQTPNPLAGLDIPATLPQGTALKIESSSAMTEVNDALKDRFAEQFSTTDVVINYQDSTTALAALGKGQADLAAVGRGLSEAEKQQGLIEVPLSRHKIALVVSPENPFAGSLTVEQFAQIFRGEITNWSQVGGPDVPIVLVDRPAASDTRQAFQNYPVFQTAPFQAAPGAVALSEDSTEAVAKALGPNGLGYAIAEQALNNPAVKVVPMHDTLPDDPRYPFSQPLAYVYNSNNPSPAALAYLGYATNPDNEAVIEAARQAAAQAEASATPVPAAKAPAVSLPSSVPDQPGVVAAPGTPPAATTTFQGKVPWWPWWLAFPLLGGLLWWLLAGRGAAAPVADQGRRIILTPRNCRDAYAYWEIPAEEAEALRRDNHSLALRLYDVTDIANLDQQAPHSVRQFTCATTAQGDYHLPIQVDDRDYVVDLGYPDDEGQWQSLARSEHVRVPACPSAVPHGVAGVGTAAAAAAVAGGTFLAKPGVKPLVGERDRIILVPRNAESAYAYWELSEAQQETLRRQGQRLTLRVADVSDDPNVEGHRVVRQYDCPDYLQDMHVEIPMENRDYVAELGYTTADGAWHRVVRSQPVHTPAKTASPEVRAAGILSHNPVTARVEETTQDATTLESVRNTATGLGGTVAKTAGDLAGDATKLTGATLAGGAAVVGAGAAAARSFLDSARSRVGRDPVVGAGIRSELGAESRIILVPRNAAEAYAYWEVDEIHREALRKQGGRQLKLRIHDATNLDIDYEPAHSTREYAISEADQDKHVTLPIADRDYVAELGYLTDDGQWLRLIRSLHVRVPA